MTHFIIIFFLALYGIILCKKIYNEKKQEKPLVCYLGADCEGVVRGQFSSFLGIGLEVYGGFYYLFIVLTYTLMYALNFSFEPTFNTAIVIISGLAFLFSLALTFIQAFVIKTWCSWCLVSAGLTTLIFILGILNIL